MHELSLFGQVPASRHGQIIQILAGVAAMPPQALLERHVLFKPTRTPVRRTLQVGGSQDIQDSQKTARQAQSGGDLYNVQVVEDLGQDSTWEMRFYDLPEPGKRPNTVRMVSTTSIADGDALSFARGLGYQQVALETASRPKLTGNRYLRQWMLSGEYLVYNNIVLSLYRVLQLPETYSKHIPETQLPTLDNAYTLEASIKVIDASKPESLANATNELARFKDLMRGCIDLRPVDRLALDTRVK